MGHIFTLKTMCEEALNVSNLNRGITFTLWANIMAWRVT